MKHISFLLLLGISLCLASCSSGDNSTAESGDTADTAANMDDDWVVLFDGTQTDLNDYWHSYLKDNVVGWRIEDGAITMDGGGGDLVTDRTYKDFEFTTEWKIGEKGNSGIVYLIDEDPQYEQPYLSGPEYQLLDDAGMAGQDLKPSQMSGSNYDMHAPTVDASKPAGQWNTSTIKVEDGYVEHWLNGAKVVEYELGTDSWQNHKAASKWKDAIGYGKTTDGHISLQDHGGGVFFRNIKIREL